MIPMILRPDWSTARYYMTHKLRNVLTLLNDWKENERNEIQISMSINKAYWNTDTPTHLRTAYGYFWIE